MRAWLLFLPILLFAQSSSPPSKSVAVDNAVPAAKGAQDSGPKKDQGAPQTPTSTSTTPTQIGPYEPQQSSKSSPTNKPPEVTPDPIVRYTFWLVIVGILQFLALILQAVFLWLAFRETTAATGLTAQALTEAQRSNAASEELTRESNTNARISADAAKESADALINVERAWMILDRFQQVNTAGSASLMIMFSFKNSGRTPAWITQFSFRLTLSPNEIIVPINYDVISDGPWADPRPIEQGAGIRDVTARLMPRPEDGTENDRASAIDRGSLYLYFFGILRYRDIFSSACETRFCYRLC
jgi:hypothetical protein